MKRSILTEKIARRGRHILREYTVDALEFMQAGQLMTRDPETLPGTMPLPEVVRFFADEATHRSYPVVDFGRAAARAGVADRRTEWKVGRPTEGRLADALSDASTVCAYPETPCGEVADMMVETGGGRVSIVDHQSRKVVGIISRQDLLKVRSTQRSVEQR